MKITWVKYHLDFFDDPRVALIEAMPEGHTLITIWFKLISFAGKHSHGGAILIQTPTKTIHPNDEMLAELLREKTTSLRLALNTYLELGLLTKQENTYHITEWTQYINETKTKTITQKTTKLTLTKKETITNYLTTHPHATNSEIARQTGIPRTTVIRYRQQLVTNQHPLTTLTDTDTPWTPNEHAPKTVKPQVEPQKQPCPTHCPNEHVHGQSNGQLMDTSWTLVKPQVEPQKEAVSKNKPIDIDKDKDDIHHLLAIANSCPQQNQNETETQHPSLAEIIEYVQANHLTVSPYRFHEYFQNRNWTTKNGQKITNWQQMLHIWNRNERPYTPFSNAQKQPLDTTTPHSAGENISQSNPPLRIEPRTSQEVVPTIEQVMKKYNVDETMAQNLIEENLY